MAAVGVTVKENQVFPRPLIAMVGKQITAPNNYACINVVSVR
jgi:hypothetical protein